MLKSVSSWLRGKNPAPSGEDQVPQSARHWYANKRPKNVTRSLFGFDAQQAAVFLVCQQIEIAVGAGTHLANALTEFAE